MPLNLRANRFEDIANRLEIPNPKSTFSRIILCLLDRWDSPCFKLAFDDPTPCEEICAAALEGKKPRDPVSTKPEIDFGADFIHALDKACQEVCEFLISAQYEMTIGDTIGIPGIKTKISFLTHHGCAACFFCVAFEQVACFPIELTSGCCGSSQRSS